MREQRTTETMTTTAIKSRVKKELKETEELFKMGFFTPQERFKRDFESKNRLDSFYRLSRTGQYKDLA